MKPGVAVDELALRSYSLLVWRLSARRVARRRASSVMPQMDIPFDDILAVVRKPGDLKAAFGALREIGRSHLPSEVWDKIGTPEVEADVWLAGAWLKESIFEFRPSGVYLGLDTLNENRGGGKNVEIGMTRAANPAALAMDWAYRLPERGENHLIEGMYKAHRAYQKFGLEYPSSLLADYLFFFGYSGLVLTAALERISVNWDCMFIWGFHDGDLGYLVRSSPEGITRLASFGEKA